MPKALESRFAGKARIAYSVGAEFFDEKYPETEVFHDPPTLRDKQLIDEAAANARQADIAIIVVGDQFNGVPGIRGTVGESASWISLDLSATGRPLMSTMMTGFPAAATARMRSSWRPVPTSPIAPQPPFCKLSSPARSAARRSQTPSSVTTTRAGN